MAGSGTTVVVARALGHTGIGFDTDPLAVRLAQAWCADVDEQAVRLAALSVHGWARLEAPSIAVRDAYPDHANQETREFICYWFDETNRRQLAALARGISFVRDVAVRSVLWCAFSRMIISKQASVSRAMDIQHSRPHRVDTRRAIRPLDVFLSAVDRVVTAAPFKRGPVSVASVKRGDARKLPVADASIDMVITSPPYLNAIDYLRGHKFTLVWMGHNVGDLRQIRMTNIGTEAALGADRNATLVSMAMSQMGGLEKLPQRHARLLARYILDMKAAISEIHRVLVPGGRVLLVVGDCWIRDVFVRNSGALKCVGESVGLRFAGSHHRKLPPNKRYLPPPSAKTSGDRLRNRMRTEVLLRFEKTA